ncbi:MAG: YqhA family protein [Chitinophagales bacterium]|nr:YqhA family protein [Hyphomicrobiales bacterium]
MSRNIWQKISSERNLLDFFFRLRGLMLIASAGAILGALLMFWTGFKHLLHAYETLIGLEAVAYTAKEATAEGESRVVVYILEAVDAFLFALVLMIFAYGIALGFVFHHVAERYRDYLPDWMLVEGVGQLKRTLAEVVIVVLIVIFARIIIESAGNLKWEMLVLPISICLLSYALKLLHHDEGGSHDSPSQSRGPVRRFGEDSKEDIAAMATDMRGASIIGETQTAAPPSVPKPPLKASAAQGNRAKPKPPRSA